MITLKTVLKDKFWILQRDNSGSVGTMRVEKDHVSVLLDEKPSQYATVDEAKSALGINEQVPVKTISNQMQDVLGYPTDLEKVYKIRNEQGLPCYTKSDTGNILHAAGWYGMHRNGLHAEAFCPKLNTLKNYPYIGPYRTQSDLRVAMISWKRNDQTGYNTIKQVLV
jgi:hypothetical protein